MQNSSIANSIQSVSTQHIPLEGQNGPSEQPIPVQVAVLGQEVPSQARHISSLNITDWVLKTLNYMKSKDLASLKQRIEELWGFPEEDLLAVLKHIDQNGSFLSWAIYTQDFAILQDILKLYQVLQQQDEATFYKILTCKNNGFSCLKMAICYNNLEIFRAVVELYKALPQAQLDTFLMPKESGDTCLSDAICSKNTEIFSTILLLYQSLKENNPEDFCTVLTTVNANGCSCLRMAFQFSNMDILTNVLELYASYDIAVLLNVLNNSVQSLNRPNFSAYLAQLVDQMQNPQIRFSSAHLNGFVEWLDHTNLPTVKSKTELMQRLLDYIKLLPLRSIKSARNS